MISAPIVSSQVNLFFMQLQQMYYLQIPYLQN